MSPLFQHLTLAKSLPDTGSDLASLMQDLEANEDQGVLAYISDENTGRRYLVKNTLGSSFTDSVRLETDYPQRQSRMSLAAHVQELDSDTSGQMTIMTKDGGKLVASQGYAAAPDQSQLVAHGGGSVWYVAESAFRVYNPDGSIKTRQVIEPARLVGTEGFIGYYQDVQVYYENTEYPYNVNCGRYVMEPSPVEIQPRLVLPAGGLFGSLSQTIWRPGQLFHAVAYVTAARADRPASIHRFQSEPETNFQWPYWGNPYQP